MQHYLIVSILLLFTTCRACVDEFPDVSTKSGKIRGRQQITSSNFHYEEFLGVQYAEFVGRFKKAVYPPKNHDGIFDATSFGSRCYQLEYLKVPFEQKDAEDCLNLNIYVPWGVKCLGTRKLAVVVAIHGGGFEFGSAAWTPGSNIIEVVRDVIFVSISYRLGIWGLLTTGDDISPGNLLYWDQHYALKWIHDNINVFGGDANEVTLWGYSAGGSSVVAQVFHKENQGLIKRAMPITGAGTYSLIGQWSCAVRDSYIRYGKNVAEALNCPTEPSWAMVECLQKVDNKLLLDVSNQPKLLDGRVLMQRWFPVIDGEFLEDVPYQLFKEGRTRGVDFLHGIGQHDAGLFLLTFADLPKQFDKEDIQRYWKAYFKSTGVSDPDMFLQNLTLQYGEDSVHLHPVTIEATERENDRMRVVPHILDLKYQEEIQGSTNNYLYVFDYHSTYSKNPDWMRGDHVEICAFAFGVVLGYPEMYNTTEEEKELSRDILRYQFNFAKYGNPNIGSGVPTEFPNWDMKSRRLLRLKPISQGGNIIESDAYLGVEDFWEHLASPKNKLDRDTLCVNP